MRQRDVSPRRWGAVACCALALAVAACRHGVPEDVEVQVRDVGFDHNAGAPVVVLQSREDQRMLPIWIGPAEAQAIATEMQNVTPPRPMTHDLVKRILEETGAALRRVRITDVQQQTFYATLVLERGGHEVEIDSRPSDAIALALRCACPILVRRALFEQAATPGGGGSSQTAAATRVWGLTVQELSPALAQSLDLDGVVGVLVSDVLLGGDEGVPRRGDVITAVDGEPVANLETLRAAARGPAASHRLDVRRGPAHLVLRYVPPPG